jgi:hypothetical protein
MHTQVCVSFLFPNYRGTTPCPRSVQYESFHESFDHLMASNPDVVIFCRLSIVFNSYEIVPNVVLACIVRHGAGKPLEIGSQYPTISILQFIFDYLSMG